MVLSLSSERKRFMITAKQENSCWKPQKKPNCRILSFEVGLPQRVRFNGVTKFRVPIGSGYLAVMWEGIRERRRSSTVSDVLLLGHWNRSFLSKARDKLLAWSATQHGYFTISKPVWELELGAYAQKVFKESVRAGQEHGYADMAMLALFIK